MSCRGSAMFTTEFQFYAMLSLIFQVSGQACSVGWFGPECRYKCHCTRSDLCSDNGTCTTTCNKTYFGPGCQYVDFVQTDGTHFLPTYLTDNNDTTCNPNASAVNVVITLKTEILPSWFRIVVSDGENKMKFITSLDGESCKHERKFIVSQNIVDVTCSNRKRFSKFEIEGAVSPNVCTVYINKGRNLALKESTDQISTFREYKVYVSSKAVDGNRNPNTSQFSCTRTNLEDQVPWWSITFSLPVVLTSVEVFNQNEVSYRLDDFQLILYNKHGSVQGTFTGKGVHMSYTLFIPLVFPISFIRIVQASKHAHKDRALTLCEVETYGDYLCPRNAYGLFCEGNCSCGVYEGCSSVTGTCAIFCPEGFYGYDCLSQCSPNCLLGKCELVSGKCSPCAAGYTDDTCTTECGPGLFGNSCMFECSNGCNGTCNFVTGYCSCKSNYFGLTCTECRPGTYGTECNFTCSVGCADTSACNNVTGSCVCKKEYTGLTCAEPSAQVSDTGYNWFFMLLVTIIICVLGIASVILFCILGKDARAESNSGNRPGQE